MLDTCGKITIVKQMMDRVTISVFAKTYLRSKQAVFLPPELK